MTLSHKIVEGGADGRGLRAGEGLAKLASWLAFLPKFWLTIFTLLLRQPTKWSFRFYFIFPWSCEHDRSTRGNDDLWVLTVALHRHAAVLQADRSKQSFLWWSWKTKWERYRCASSAKFNYTHGIKNLNEEVSWSDGLERACSGELHFGMSHWPPHAIVDHKRLYNASVDPMPICRRNRGRGSSVDAIIVWI